MAKTQRSTGSSPLPQIDDAWRDLSPAALRELNQWLHKGLTPDGPKQVRVLPGYWIDATEVTVAEYNRFVAATGRTPVRRQA